MSDVLLKPAFTALTEEKNRNRKVKGQVEGDVKRKTRGRRRAL